MNRQLVLTAVAFFALASIAQFAWAQIYDGATIPSGKYGSYTDYYNKNVNNATFTPISPQQFDRDRYVYQNPILSPYLDLSNRRENVLPNYYNNVLPTELSQQSQPYSRNLRARANALHGADPLNGVGYTPYGSARMPTAEPYYNNHWYGSWAR
jgi:hypothetical protein